MSPDGEVRPPDDSWVVALHSSEHDIHPSGSGLVIDRQRILTCAHVARSIQDSGCEIWVAFPKSTKGPVPRLRMAREHVVFADSGAEVQDLAVLHSPESVPPGVDPVPLRDPASASLLSRRWWAFGFPQGHPAGNAAQGTVGEVLANGLLRIDRKSRYGIESGFSGAGVWSPEYRAVVAVVTEAENRRGDGQAIPLHHLEACFPGGQIADLTGHWSAVEAGDVALSAWGWSLTGDPEAERHWSPRARGVTGNDEHGYRFRGRTAALLVIKDWLDRDRDRAHRRMLVVTGAPGAGKSAVLGRVVTTADADAVRELPASDMAVRATVGSVACAVHAKGKTALEVATEIARAASAELPDDLEDFPRVLHAALIRQDRRFNVIIDALDEAVSLAEARNIIRKVLLPMTETFSDVDARVVAGSRRAGATGDLLGRYRESLRLVDLDNPEFYGQEDLAAYALATLQLAGDERPENEEGKGRKPNPYADARVAGPVAARIAELSAGNFLVAGLTARTRGMTDDTPKSPEQISFSPRISDVIDDYLELIPEVADIDARDLLTALAFAESPGLPVSLWRKAIQALGYGNVTEVQLARFTQTRAASFLIESSEQDGHGTVFRLFHQALNDALLNSDEPGTVRPTEEEALTRAFMSIGRDGGWERAPAYLLRSLPAHAARAGLVDDLLADSTYLLHADLHRVIQVANQAVSPAVRGRGRLLGLTPEALTAEPSERAAMFSVTEALEHQLGNTYRTGNWQAPYQARWAVSQARSERAIFRGHQSPVQGVYAVTANNRELLASVGGDRTVRLWDPLTGEQADTMWTRHHAAVRAACVVSDGDRKLLASASEDGTVRLWDPVACEQVSVLNGHHNVVYAVCAVSAGERELLASVGSDAVRVWDAPAGAQIAVLGGHQGEARAVCAVRVGGRELLAIADRIGTVRVWDPRTGEQTVALESHQGLPGEMCVVDVGGRELLAIFGIADVQLWDLAAGEHIVTLEGHTRMVTGVCAVTIDGRELLATAGWDAVRVWDPRTGEQTAGLESHQRDHASGVWAVRVGGLELLAIADYGGSVRLWDPTPGEKAAVLKGHQVRVQAICAVAIGGREFLASAGEGAVGVWDPRTGEQTAALEGHRGPVNAVCVVIIGGREFLASAGGGDGTVQLWDPRTHEQTAVLRAHQGSVYGYKGSVYTVCAVSAGGRELLASGGSDGTVRLWDPRTCEPTAVLRGHGARGYGQGWVNTVCAVSAGDRELLASGGDDGVRVWDPQTGGQIAVLDAHQRTVSAVCAVTIRGRGLLASASGDGTVRIWDPRSGEHAAVLGGQGARNLGWVHTVCAVSAGGRELLASGGDDQTVRLWDLSSGICVAAIPTHHPVRAIAPVAGTLAIGLDTGMLVIKLNDLS
jgi:WD40 repeat protein